MKTHSNFFNLNNDYLDILMGDTSNNISADWVFCHYDRIYLVDCENVGFTFFSGPEDMVIYFVNPSMKYPFKINKNEILITFKHNGLKDALDFAINTYLGYLINEYNHVKNTYPDLNNKFYIISNDKGYANVANFWKSSDVQIYTNPHIGCSETVKAKNVNNNLNENQNSHINISNSKKGKEQINIASIQINNSYNISVLDLDISKINLLDTELKQKIQNVYDEWLNNYEKNILILKSNLNKCLCNTYRKKEINTIAVELYQVYACQKYTA